MALFQELKQNIKSAVHPVLQAFDESANRIANLQAGSEKYGLRFQPVGGFGPAYEAQGQLMAGQDLSPEAVEALKAAQSNQLPMLAGMSGGVKAGRDYANWARGMRQQVANTPVETIKQMSQNPKPLKLLQSEMDAELVKKVGEGFINDDTISAAYNKVFSNRY